MEGDNTEMILDIAKARKHMMFENILSKDTTVIVDFYNCYCTMIKFCKYRTFSLDTYKMCLQHVIDAIAGRKAYIISKNIFEVDIRVILDLTSRYPNITYIIVEDSNEIKSINRERDDYVCILIQALTNPNARSVISSNDHFSNFEKILEDIKPFSLVVINNGAINSSSINSVAISTYNEIIKSKNNLNRCGFRFMKTNKFEFFKK